MSETRLSIVPQIRAARLDPEEICRLYVEGGISVSALLARSGMGSNSFYRLLRSRGLRLRRPQQGSHPPDLPVFKPGESKPLRREDLIARLWDAASVHMGQIEQRLHQLNRDEAHDASAQGTENELKLMGLIVKTLRDLLALDADLAGARKKETAQDELDDALATSPDSMREELARRLAGLRESR